MARRGRKTLIQRIALDGGEEIRKDLEALGAEGKAAFEALTRAAAKTAEAGSELNQFVRSVRREFDQLSKAGKDVRKSLQEIGSATRHTATRITVLAGAVTAAAAALFTLSLRGAQAADEIAKASESVGMTTEEFTKWEFAATQSGLSAEQFRNSLGRLSMEIERTFSAAEPMTTVLGRMGIEVRNMDGTLRSASDVMRDVSGVFASMPDGVEKTSLAMEIFGVRIGTRLLPLLNQTNRGLDELFAQAERGGLVVTEAQAKIATAMVDAVALTRRAFSALQRDVGLLFAPAFTEVANAFTEVIANSRETVLGLGEDLRDRVVPVLEDFIALLEGREGDVQTQWLLDVRDAVVEIAGALQMVVSVGRFVFDVLAGALEPVARLLNLIFGTELTGRALVMFALLGKFTGAFRLIGASIRGVIAVFQFLVRVAGNVVAMSTALVTGLLVGLSTLEQIFIRVAEWATTTAGRIVAFFTGASEESVGAVKEAGEAGESAMGQVANAADEAAGSVSDNMQGAAGDTVQAFDTAVPKVEGLFDSLRDKMGSVYNAVTRWLRAIIDLAKDAIAAVAALAGFAGGGAVEGFSTGGQFRGRGTGTSDSNIIRVSNGEYIIRAAAVRRYGTSLMNAINSMALSTSSIKGFAGGGLVQGAPSLAVAVPQGASGGAVSAGRPFALHLGSEVFEGLLAPDDVADRMMQFATRAKVKRTGRMPAWYGS